MRFMTRGFLIGSAAFALMGFSTSAVLAATQVQIVNCTGAPGCYQPLMTSVPAGTPVTWSNASSLPHTATSDSGGWTAGSVTSPIAPGSSASVTFSTPGTFTYHCEIHPSMAHGTIVVTAAAASPTPTPAPTRSATPAATRAPAAHLARTGGGPASLWAAAAAPLGAALLLVGLGIAARRGKGVR